MVSCLNKAVIYGLILTGILAIQTFSDKLFKWWIFSGILWAVGVMFYILDKLKEEKNGKEI